MRCTRHATDALTLYCALQSSSSGGGSSQDRYDDGEVAEDLDGCASLDRVERYGSKVTPTTLLDEIFVSRSGTKFHSNPRCSRHRVYGSHRRLERCIKCWKLVPKPEDLVNKDD